MAPDCIFRQSTSRYSVGVGRPGAQIDDGHGWLTMTKSDKVLVILFRYLLGIGSLFALVPVVMPMSWMAATHRWLGLGEMPTGPIVEYLARCLSAFYALVGAICLVMASDLDRYRPLVRFFGECLALLGMVFTGVDLAAGMPWWWTALEGPGAVPLGALVYVLARPAYSNGGTA